MMWKFLAGVWFIIAGFIVGVWFAHGTQILSKDKVQVVTKRINPTFGMEEEIIEWKPQFRLGLEYGAPSVALCLAVGVVCLRIARSQKQPS